MHTVVFTFGRMNPPTCGHERLIITLVETAKSYSADHVVYLSQTHKLPDNPLEWSFKRRVCEAAFKGVYISNDPAIRNPYIALEHLAESYDNVIMVVGSDQLSEFSNNFSPYAKKWGIQFHVVSAGERLDESDDMVENISASKLRQYALENNKKKFFEGLPSTLKPAIMELVYKNVQKGLKKPR